MNSMPASRLLLPPYSLDMKFIFKNRFRKQPQQIISALFLTGILSLGSGLTLLQSATAAPRNRTQETTGEMVKGLGYAPARANDSPANRLPSPVANAVRQDLSRQVKIPASKLRITKFSQQTWPDGCLGLLRTDEFCTQALVEGWRIVVSDGSQTWVYRTDSKGRVMRLEHQTASANSV